MAQRATALLQRKHRASGDSASPSSTLADISAPTAVATNGDGAPGGVSAAAATPLSPPGDARQGGRGKRSTKQPCEACGEADARDCATCYLCGARCHP